MLEFPHRKDEKDRYIKVGDIQAVKVTFSK